jgi:hypothetical protein
MKVSPRFFPALRFGSRNQRHDRGREQTHRD